VARSDLLLNLVRAGRVGDQALLKRAAEALVAEERAKSHHILADRIEAALRPNGLVSDSVSISDEQSERFVHQSVPRRRLEDVVLDQPAMTVCQELVEEHQRAELLRAYNLEPRHRVLLIGPPGNGKTTLAEALAAEMLLPLYTVRYEGVIASYLGETASRVSRLLEFVRMRQCVLFFDEFDAIAKERGDPHDTGEVKRVVSSLLLQIDALPSHVVVITATNHPELLDRAVWRRFQVRIQLDKPNQNQRERFLSRYQTPFATAGVFPVTSVGHRLAGLSYAEIEDFMTDLQRKYVLALPDVNFGKLLNTNLTQWAGRLKRLSMKPRSDIGHGE